MSNWICFLQLILILEILIPDWCTPITSSLDLGPSTTPSERYFRPIILESASLNPNECFSRNPLVPMPLNSYNLPPGPSSALSTVSSSQGELFSAFTSVPPSKHTTLNTKKHHHHHHPILTDQSSSSADSGVHSSYTQSPIAKHSFRKWVSLHSEMSVIFIYVRPR